MRLSTRLWLALRALPSLPILLVIGLLHVIHPFVHGTPLDGGLLDGALANLTALGASLTGVSGLDAPGEAPEPPGGPGGHPHAH